MNDELLKRLVKAVERLADAAEKRNAIAQAQLESGGTGNGPPGGP